MLRFLFVFSATTFSSYNPDIAKKGACARGVTPFRWGPRGGEENPFLAPRCEVHREAPRRAASPLHGSFPYKPDEK